MVVYCHPVNLLRTDYNCPGHLHHGYVGNSSSDAIHMPCSAGNSNTLHLTYSYRVGLILHQRKTKYSPVDLSSEIGYLIKIFVKVLILVPIIIVFQVRVSIPLLFHLGKPIIFAGVEVSKGFLLALELLRLCRSVTCVFRIDGVI